MFASKRCVPSPQQQYFPYSLSCSRLAIPSATIFCLRVSCSLLVQLEQLVHEYRKLRSQRDEQGAADKVTRSIRNNMKRRRTKMNSILQQVESWGILLTPPLAPMSNDQLKSWLETGDYPIHGQSPDIHIGRRLYMSQQELLRCQEEQVELRKEVKRLKHWIDCMLNMCAHKRSGMVIDTLDVYRSVQSVADIARACACLDNSVGINMWLNRHAKSLLEMQDETNQLWKIVFPSGMESNLQ